MPCEPEWATWACGNFFSKSTQLKTDSFMLISRHVRAVFAAMVVLAWLVAGTWAIAAESGPAPTDADLAIQGEFAGHAWLPSRGHRPVGLQVIARGQGRFAAMFYEGGLPGNGWDRVHRFPMSGQIADGLLSLAGEGLTLTTDGESATVYAADGDRVGSLVKVDRASQTLGQSPPPGATVLFDNGPTEQLTGARISVDGLLQVGATTKAAVQDFRLHLEFRLPYMPTATGQGRGNSGVYIQRRYEVQILDSFGLEGIENECGSLYRQQRPDLNMCFPPLVWQTYDIWFTAARFDDAGKKTAPARITVRHNGMAVHRDYEITGKTGNGQPEGLQALPIHFQDHGNPVHFRNVWIVMSDPAEEAAEASIATSGCDSRHLLGGRLLRHGRRCP